MRQGGMELGAAGISVLLWSSPESFFFFFAEIMTGPKINEVTS